MWFSAVIWLKWWLTSSAGLPVASRLSIATPTGKSTVFFSGSSSVCTTGGSGTQTRTWSTRKVDVFPLW